MGVYTDQLQNEVRLEHMRPEQIEFAKKRRSAIYVPFGALEWHGYQNATGLDGLKAHEQLVGLADRHGGVVYPPVYFGAGGAHKTYANTYMVDAEPMIQIVVSLLQRFEATGYERAILVSGHYPNLADYMEPGVERYRDAGGTMKVMATAEGYAQDVHGDHAGKNETSFMMHLYPETVDLDKLAGEPKDYGPPDERINWMGDEFLDHPCYGIVGIDPRPYAAADVGKVYTERFIAFMAEWLDEA